MFKDLKKLLSKKPKVPKRPKKKGKKKGLKKKTSLKKGGAGFDPLNRQRGIKKVFKSENNRYGDASVAFIDKENFMISNYSSGIFLIKDNKIIFSKKNIEIQNFLVTQIVQQNGCYFIYNGKKGEIYKKENDASEMEKILEFPKRSKVGLRTPIEESLRLSDELPGVIVLIENKKFSIFDIEENEILDSIRTAKIRDLRFFSGNELVVGFSKDIKFFKIDPKSKKILAGRVLQDFKQRAANNDLEEGEEISSITTYPRKGLLGISYVDFCAYSDPHLTCFMLAKITKIEKKVEFLRRFDYSQRSLTFVKCLNFTSYDNDKSVVLTAMSLWGKYYFTVVFEPNKGKILLLREDMMKKGVEGAKHQLIRVGDRLYGACGKGMIFSMK